MQTTEQRTPQEIAHELAYGKTLSFKLPSGYEVTIREQNGNDDDILSNSVNAKDMTNFNIFLSSLIINTNLPFAEAGKITLEGAKKLLVKDKYYIIIRSRIHSIGEELKVRYNWGETNGGELTYTEDLNRYIWDYDKPFPGPGDTDYDVQKVEPYILEKPYEEQEVILQSGRKLKFHLYNGYSEVSLLKLPADQHTRNSEIKARNLREFIDGRWVKVESFISFRVKEMSELKKLINTVDPPFRAMTELENPNSGEILEFPILGSMDFFYPEEI